MLARVNEITCSIRRVNNWRRLDHLMRGQTSNLKLCLEGCFLNWSFKNINVTVLEIL